MEKKRQAKMEMAKEEDAPKKESGQKTEITDLRATFQATASSILTITTVWGHGVVWHPRGLQLRE